MSSRISNKLSNSLFRNLPLRLNLPQLPFLPHLHLRIPSETHRLPLDQDSALSDLQPQQLLLQLSAHLPHHLHLQLSERQLLQVAASVHLVKRNHQLLEEEERERVHSDREGQLDRRLEAEEHQLSNLRQHSEPLLRIRIQREEEVSVHSHREVHRRHPLSAVVEERDQRLVQEGQHPSRRPLSVRQRLDRPQPLRLDSDPRLSVHLLHPLLLQHSALPLLVRPVQLLLLQHSVNLHSALPLKLHRQVQLLVHLEVLRNLQQHQPVQEEDLDLSLLPVPVVRLQLSDRVRLDQEELPRALSEVEEQYLRLVERLEEEEDQHLQRLAQVEVLQRHSDRPLRQLSDPVERLHLLSVRLVQHRAHSDQAGTLHLQLLDQEERQLEELSEMRQLQHSLEEELSAHSVHNPLRIPSDHQHLLHNLPRQLNLRRVRSVVEDSVLLDQHSPRHRILPLLPCQLSVNPLLEALEQSYRPTSRIRMPRLKRSGK